MLNEGKQISVKVPTHLMRRIEERAKKNYRTISSEVVWILEKAFNNEPLDSLRTTSKESAK